MRIAKIKNKYMYETRPNDVGIHHYLVFYDKKRKQYNAVQLTHLYIKDKKRFTQVKKGLIRIEKFKEFDVPSGIRNNVYTSNVYGQKIDLKDKRNVLSISNRYLSKSQSNRIKRFINKKKT